MWRGISLANKCLLLFGAAVVLIIVAALAVPWVRMTWMLDESQLETSRALVQAWERQERERTEAGGKLEAGVEQIVGGGPDVVGAGAGAGSAGSGGAGGGAARVVFYTAAQVTEKAKEDDFVAAAWNALTKNPQTGEFSQAEWRGTSREYRFAKVPVGPGFSPQGLIVMTRTATNAASRLLVNTVYLLSAGLMALGLAVLVFYLITTRLILSPVRALKETAERVREGNLATRSDISTGDEFEELSDTFNQMLEALSESQDRLRSVNKSLDMKVSELSERNVELYQAAKLKGDFLANVSHELRTPLNSILGFAELLDETAGREEAAGDDSSRLQKRRRYIGNIVSSSRSLLEMINGLLEMAKVEAGKSDLRIELVNLRDVCDGLVALMRPMADKRAVTLELESAPDLPLVETDVGKLQQIVFNLLSNAVKFSGTDATGSSSATSGPPAPAPNASDSIAAPSTPLGGHEAHNDGRAARVSVRLERLPARGGSAADPEDRVRICVLDTGPGIAPEDQKVIFDKFRQLDTGHTRRHTGTGLGLAICKELTSLLQGELAVESELGRGSMFSVILPIRLNPERAAEMHLEMRFRGELASQR